jgi:hypothetical protein
VVLLFISLFFVVVVAVNGRLLVVAFGCCALDECVPAGMVRVVENVVVLLHFAVTAAPFLIKNAFVGRMKPDPFNDVSLSKDPLSCFEEALSVFGVVMVTRMGGDFNSEDEDAEEGILGGGEDREALMVVEEDCCNTRIGLDRGGDIILGAEKQEKKYI